jgi:hypothetical protein
LGKKEEKQPDHGYEDKNPIHLSSYMGNLIQVKKTGHRTNSPLALPVAVFQTVSGQQSVLQALPGLHRGYFHQIDRRNGILFPTGS